MSRGKVRLLISAIAALPVLGLLTFLLVRRDRPEKVRNEELQWQAPATREASSTPGSSPASAAQLELACVDEVLKRALPDESNIQAELKRCADATDGSNK